MEGSEIRREKAGRLAGMTLAAPNWDARLIVPR